MSNNTLTIAIVAVVVVLLLVLTIFMFKPKKMDTDSDIQTYSIDEVAKHADQNSCWLLIEGKVYDVTNFIPEHPGGAEILKGCGKDATELFNTKAGRGIGHSGSAHEMLKDYYIGDLNS